MSSQLVIGPVGNGMQLSSDVSRGEAAPKLDQRTLKDQQRKMEEWGVTDRPTRSEKYCVTVYEFENGSGPKSIEATVVRMDDGFVTNRAKKEKIVDEIDEPKKRQSKEDLERSARRSAKSIRHLCMAMEATNMITCTTKEAIVCRDEFGVLVRSFFKKIRAKWPDFKYVGVFERHDSHQTSDEKRHSLHLHFAIAGYMDYPTVLDFWRKTVADHRGTEYKNAQIYGSVKSNGRSLVNPEIRQRQVARYLGKYVAKEVESGEPHRKRYWASRNIQKPKPKRFYIASCTYPKEFFRAVLEDIFECDLQTVWQPEFKAGTIVPMFFYSTA